MKKPKPIIRWVWKYDLHGSLNFHTVAETKEDCNEVYADWLGICDENLVGGKPVKIEIKEYK